MPVDGFTVAIDVELLLQVPAPALLKRVIVLPTATLVGPDIVPAVRVAITVINFEEEIVPQPVVAVWVITAEPSDTPVTTPVGLIVATPVDMLAHVPPVPLAVDVRDILPGKQILPRPMIESVAVVDTVKALVAVHPAAVV
jgi:hypothetical protein